jgi:hypothetical protein
MIVSREGGHNRPAPGGLERYLPYQTSIVKSAGAEETVLYATRQTSARNNMDATSLWRNRSYRMSRSQKGWYDWIKLGAQTIEQKVNR